MPEGYAGNAMLSSSSSPHGSLPDDEAPVIYGVHESELA